MYKKQGGGGGGGRKCGLHIINKNKIDEKVDTLLDASNEPN